MNGKTPFSVFSPLPRGSGAERVHRTLGQALPGYRVIAYSPHLEYFPMALAAFRRARRSLTHVPPDHAVLVAPRTGRLFVTFHNYVLDEGMAPYRSAVQALHYKMDLRFLIERALKRADAVSAVSHATAALVQEDLGYGGEIQVIPNGIDTRIFRPVATAGRTSEPVRVLFSGNPTRRKGATWLPGIAALLESGAEIAVTGGLRETDAVRAAPGIRALSRVEPRDMPVLYRRFDLLLAPTVREGMSLSVLEAMASGLPVVASDIPSIREIVDPNKGGILCPVGDVGAFAAAIDRLAAAPVLRKQMGEYNRTRIESEYTVGHMVERYRTAFAQVLGSG